MKSSIDFLKAIGHTDRIYIRCLSPKNTPLPELAVRGMTYTDKSDKVKKSTVNGYISIQTGEFYRRYGKDYKPVTDGWQHLVELNQQGYGIYFVVAHGGERNNDITRGTTLFHESDRATLEQQQLEIDRISIEFGKPTAVVKTKKSLHCYWSSSETIAIENLATYQRRWLQFSNCDDSSLADPAQLMRLPGFDHLAWNGTDFDRVECELLQLSEASYSLEQFDRILPALDVDRYCQLSLELVESDADDRDMRTLAQYLPGFDTSGKWIKAKCPAHGGESSDSLHIDSETGGFICHGGCSSSAVYNATKAVAVVAGHRFEVVSIDTELSQNLKESLNLKNGKAPNLFGGELGNLLSIAAANFNIPVEILNFCLLPILGSQIKSETDLLINPGTDYKVRAIRWCGLVGETGTKKSPIIDILTGAMSSIQREIAERYKAEKLEYDAAFRAWKASKPPDRGDEPAPVTPMMDLYFSDFTIESISQSISNHPHSGYLVYNDELAGFFKSMDAYRKNGGGDRQKWLTLYNGGALKVNRKSSDTIFIPQTSVSIVGGIQPNTIEHLISGDESQEDGLWNRFMFTRLPQTRIDAFSHTPYSLTEHLETLYRTLASQESFRHYLSEESKPLWAEWHSWTEDKTFSESSWIARGTYAKIEGIAARNALIIHRTMAAIAGVIPDRQISALTMELAIAWTKWELSQTLLEYQMLGLTDDPELSKILKFIDKFTGKDWVSARDVRNWWSVKPKPEASEIKSFMVKVVGLGHAIDNDEPSDSGKYRIQILGKGSPSSPQSGETQTHQHFTAGLSVVHDYQQQNQATSQGAGLDSWTTDSPESSPSLNIADTEQSNDDDSESWTKTWTTDSPAPQTTINGHHSDSVTKTWTTDSPVINNISSKGSSDSWTKWTTFPNKNILKIGDRAKLGDDIFIIDKIEGDFIGGQADDGSYIGGHINSVQLISTDELIDNSAPPKPDGKIDRVPQGNGMVELVRQQQTEKTNDDGVIEYEC
jgi:Protein of unknown function (DUF3987)